MRAEAHVATPALVEIRPGLWVVEDYHQPVFYSDGYYWLYDGGVWYRSTVHHSSWSRVQVNYVPVVVRRVDRPRRYVRYHARDRARVRRGPPPHRRNERVPVKRGSPATVHRRDHRSHSAPGHAPGHVERGPAHRAPPASHRDHRRDSRRGPSHKAPQSHPSKPAKGNVRDHRSRDKRDHRSDDKRDHRSDNKRDHRSGNTRDHRSDNKRDHRSRDHRNHN
ncbi:MAG: hypothetical protein Tsb0020_09940 [Haliangiales bacterium]